jgi:hypothetical protein
MATKYKNGLLRSLRFVLPIIIKIDLRKAWCFDIYIHYTLFLKTQFFDNLFLFSLPLVHICLSTHLFFQLYIFKSDINDIPILFFESLFSIANMKFLAIATVLERKLRNDPWIS